MTKFLRRFVIACLAGYATCAIAFGQAPQVPQVPAAPQGFQLNQIQQGYLDQVLSSWQSESAKVTIFQCPFERWEYNQAFGPGGDLPLNKNKGDLSYQKPDKGSFQITEVRTWQAKPVPAGGAPPAQANGDWVVQPDAIGEHWVCDGESVYEYRHDQKQLVVRPIPPAMRGQAIVDGPLPFLFGAETAKLKARYWMRAEQTQDPNTIMIVAQPKFAANAADYKQVDLMLDRTRMMPKAMQVHLPNGDRHVYMFDIAKATVNGHLQRIMALFSAPTAPWGWKKVVDTMPADGPPAPLDGRQAAQPDGVPR